MFPKHFVPKKAGGKFWGTVALRLYDSLGEKPAALLQARFCPHTAQELEAGRISAAAPGKHCCSAAPAPQHPWAEQSPEQSAEGLPSAAYGNSSGD